MTLCLNPICRAAADMLAKGVDTRPVVRGAISRAELEQQRRKWSYSPEGYSPHQGQRECARRRAVTAAFATETVPASLNPEPVS